MDSQTGSVQLPDHRRLSYELSGHVAGPVVILSNSLLTSVRLWDIFVDDLHQKGFRVLRYDQPGHGSSSVPEDPTQTTFLTLSADVKTLLDRLQIAQVYAWVGISMGAAKGAFFVTQYPGVVAKLVLCDTISCSPQNAGIADPFAARVALAREKATAIDELTEQTLGRWFQEDWRREHADETARMRAAMRVTRPGGFIACCNALQHQSFDLKPLMPKIGACVQSVLVVVGELDADLPISMAAMKDEIERTSASPVDMVIIPRAGHVPVVDGREVFTEKVMAFLGSPSLRDSKV
ncbi:hypothetical protein ASPZODRAFT_15301 [Penicilliopsis zonata CBS 506.65]|uniref:AB hydrolase-1 domain-containing protein n=1 Tax=Penicilliopsis zonata CBS 506.65 TaxID=1073090 RepID=A0A1L9SKZ7_9EURO|nr:hypothetical protein ASPZODRAFT_15301 [Penicilliopsis zonata CBS 506.65]OJJ47855.1 hypothetical protein ASPZODRAFT_15301 [Penicilliopsis zonata CBS 506.65]